MQNISQLRDFYFEFRAGEARWQDCVDWAIARLRADEEGDDLDVVMLAASTHRDEAEALTKTLVERYVAPGALDDEVAAGKRIVALQLAFKNATESAISLDPKIWRVYNDSGMPPWLSMLARNCEYATDMPEFEKPFEDEFTYISSLWRDAASKEQFLLRYDPTVSKSHDAWPSPSD
jgi:hypothetical protein